METSSRLVRIVVTSVLPRLTSRKTAAVPADKNRATTTRVIAWSGLRSRTTSTRVFQKVSMRGRPRSAYDDRNDDAQIAGGSISMTGRRFLHEETLPG